MKFIALLSLFAGEAFVIWAEMLGAKLYAQALPLWKALGYTAIPLCVGALLLVIAYMIGFRYFANIWIVSAISLGTILVVEPLFNLLYIGQTPTTGASIGLLLGILGILSSIFF